MKAMFTMFFTIFALAAQAQGISATAPYEYQTGAKPCARGGCAGELCVEPGSENALASTCSVKAEMACLAYAVCARSSAGVCGWQPRAGGGYESCLEAVKSGRFDTIPSAIITDTRIVPNVDYIPRGGQ